MSKNKGFSRVMALVLLICMVVSFAPAAYADVDENKAVQEESVVEDNVAVKDIVAGEANPNETTDEATPEKPAVPSGENSIKELFKFHCTADETHADQTYNWFGSYVMYNGDMQYDAERGVWTASAKITNVATMLSSGVNSPEKVWGVKHYHTDANGNKLNTATIKLVWNPDAVGKNASGVETTGLWLPDGEQLVNVWCATAPAAPTIAKSFTKSAGSGVAIRVQDSAYEIPQYAQSYSKVTYFKYLKEGTYEFTPVTKDENGDFWCDLVIDPTSYIDEFNTANKADPAFRLDPNKPVSNFTYKMKYTGSKTSYATDGSGWAMQSASSYDKTIGETAKTGKVAYVAQYYTVTYTDGADGAAFASQTYNVKPGEATPAFDGTPTRENYTFKGWTPEVADTVTGDVTYVATWEPTTAKKPRNISSTQVNQMSIRAYAEGTEVLSNINEMSSCTPSIKAKGVSFTIHDVTGNDADGYTTSVTFHFYSGDTFEAAARNVFNTDKHYLADSEWKEHWTGNWSYDFGEYTGSASNGKTRPADQTINLKWVVTVNRLGKETGSWKLLKDGEVYGANITTAVANLVQVNLKLNRTVTYTDGVDGEEVFADQVYTVANGSTAPAFNGTPARAGYKFAGWEPAFDANAKIYADTTYTAIWEKLFTVTYTDGVDGEEVFADEVYADIESGTATPAFSGSTERPGWDFMGWKPEVAETVTADATYTAQWKTRPANTIYYDANGGEGGPSNNFSNAIYATVQNSVPTRDGYAFAGWNTAADGTGDSYKGGDKYYFTAAHNGETVTLYAQWIKTYVVTYSDGVNGEAFATESYEVVVDSKTPAFTGTPEREGYVFKGWAPEVAETVTEDVTYVAQWTALYTVTYTDGVDGEVLFPDQSTTVEDGSKTPAFTGTPERKGYTFAGWQPAVAETVTGNVTYAAQWTANEYVLTRDSNGGDKLDDVNVTYDAAYGDAIVSSPRAGYTEDGWFLIVDKELTNTEVTAESIVNIASDHGIFLKRSIAPVTLTVSEDVTKDYDGKQVVLTASTDEYDGLAYSYQWYKDGAAIDGETGKTLTLAGNVSDTGAYTVKVTVTNTGDSGVITRNKSVEAEASVNVTVNKIDNHLTYNYNGADEKDSTVDTIESSITVDADKEITRKGYDFLGWNTKADGTGDSYKSGDELTFVDNGNGGEEVTLYAQWKGKEYKLTFKIKEDPDFTEDVKLNFTSKTVVYGEKVGQFPYATRKDHILVWYDKDGKRVDSETVYLVEGDSTYTGVWTEYKPVVATGDNSNIALYAAAMFASLACIGAGIVLLRRKREE